MCVLFARGEARVLPSSDYFPYDVASRVFQLVNSAAQSSSSLYFGSQIVRPSFVGAFLGDDSDFDEWQEEEIGGWRRLAAARGGAGPQRASAVCLIDTICGFTGEARQAAGVRWRVNISHCSSTPISDAYVHRCGWSGRRATQPVLVVALSSNNFWRVNTTLIGFSVLLGCRLHLFVHCFIAFKVLHFPL